MQLVLTILLCYTGKFLPTQRFPYTNWQTVAAESKLVLVGSDCTLLSQPGVKWTYKVAGGNQLGHFQSLMSRIPHDDNPTYNLPPGGLPLGIMRLEDFYTKFPSMLFFFRYISSY